MLCGRPEGPLNFDKNLSIFLSYYINVRGIYQWGNFDEKWGRRQGGQHPVLDFSTVQRYNGWNRREWVGTGLFRLFWVEAGALGELT